MWFEVAVVSTMFAVGNIVFGHFALRGWKLPGAPSAHPPQEGEAKE